MTGRLSSWDSTVVFPGPAVLLSPDDGQYPRHPPMGQRFGAFEWQPSASTDVVAEIVEFAYQDDARLFVEWPSPDGLPRRVSAGRLWTTGGDWFWRVWTVTRTGRVVFSAARTFQR